MKITYRTLFFISFFCATLSYSAVAQDDKITFQALMYWDKAIHDAPTNAVAYSTRGMMYFSMQQYENALKDFNQSLKLNPNQNDLYYFRALAKENSGEYEAALVDFDKAVALSIAKPNYFHFMHRGQVRYNLGKYKEALSDINKALMMSPNNEALQHLKVDAEGAIQSATPTPADKAPLNPGDPQSDPAGYITIHHFTTLEEGKSYYDRLEHLGVSVQQLSELKKQLRHKVVHDMFGEDPDTDQLRELNAVLADQKWLLPEGQERYNRYLSESSSMFTGREDVADIIYTYTVEKDPRTNRYNLDIRKLENEQLNLAFSSMISSHSGANPNDIVVDIYHAENTGYQWRIFPSDYLELQYPKGDYSLSYAVVGSRLVAMAGRLPEKVTSESLRTKMDKAGFIEKAAIKHAIRVLIFQYGKLMGRQ